MPGGDERFLIPPGGKLLHVGPHKTGSTAIQHALHQAREELIAQSVRYTSWGRHDGPAVRWITDRLIAGSNVARAERLWHKQVAAMADSDTRFARRVFSSEFLSDATDPQVDTILDQIGGERAYVAVTLRPLAKILPSQYQQAVHRGSQMLYEPWLQEVLLRPESLRSRRFWLRQRHDELVRRWGERVGFDHVVVIVLDPRDFAVVPRAFEQLLALRPGTLAEKKVMTNRSYTLPELEIVRAFHAQARAAGLTEDERTRLILRTSRYVKGRPPGPDEPKLQTPHWAVEEANRVGVEMAERIDSFGVHVIGDLDGLGTAPHDRDADVARVEISPDLAAHFALGAALADSAEA